jgi:uncharacterized membrane protein YvbJ
MKKNIKTDGMSIVLMLILVQTAVSSVTEHKTTLPLIKQLITAVKDGDAEKVTTFVHTKDSTGNTPLPVAPDL